MDVVLFLLLSTGGHVCSSCCGWEVTAAEDGAHRPDELVEKPRRRETLYDHRLLQSGSRCESEVVTSAALRVELRDSNSAARCVCERGVSGTLGGNRPTSETSVHSGSRMN
ncbi:unnamed protein product [Pleuronectes platessa]|uniref:Secreted protein n=1 Tax=Pleuronectes platessa TaxID=8262 RepID=A0A9N7URL8_PLEPL|nr:unnamed protein product [Pleuronectes platessa]